MRTQSRRFFMVKVRNVDSKRLKRSRIYIHGLVSSVSDNRYDMRKIDVLWDCK